MSEEEKKAIWYFSEVLTYEEDKEQWKVIENLIEKQQKEIKELKREKDISISVMNTKSMFLESISKELGLTDEKTEGFVFTDIIKEIRKLKKIIDKQQKEIEA